MIDFTNYEMGYWSILTSDKKAACTENAKVYLEHANSLTNSRENDGA